ncbi:MAG: hypothetical protein HKO57_09740 [Akkermansiaceae bacterium]|nr:hypothetical protein [Akkermansiaceae bacterium]
MRSMGVRGWVGLAVAMVAGAAVPLEAAEPVIKAGEKVTLTGTLQGGIMAIGGETTGWRLTYRRGEKPAKIEVDMAAIAEARKFDGAEVTVKGRIISKSYVERGPTLILKAATVTPEKEAPAPPAAPGNVKLPGITINIEEGAVDVEGTVCLHAGMLEFVACTKGTKEHESIVAVDARPMHIHTALLLLGAQPGNPAMRRLLEEDGGRWVEYPPRGGPVHVSLVFAGDDGKTVERPIGDFITRAADDIGGAPGAGEEVEDRKFPTNTFLFAGSQLHGDGPGPRRYLADGSGHVISISTFGDEVLCLPGVHGHDNGALIWEINPAGLPDVGAKVTLRLRPRGGSKDRDRSP